jgi:hypothetical protein
MRESKLAYCSRRLRDGIRAVPPSSPGCSVILSITRTSSMRTGSGVPCRTLLECECRVGSRPPLSPQEGWLSNGRRVPHFRPLRYDRWSQSLKGHHR